MGPILYYAKNIGINLILASMIVDEAEINFGRAASFGCAASRPRRQVVFLDKPDN